MIDNEKKRRRNSGIESTEEADTQGKYIAIGAYLDVCLQCLDSNKRRSYPGLLISRTQGSLSPQPPWEAFVQYLDARLMSAHKRSAEEDQKLEQLSGMEERVSARLGQLSEEDSRILTTLEQLSKVDGRVSEKLQRLSEVESRVTAKLEQLTQVKSRMSANLEEFSEVNGRVSANSEQFSDAGGRVSKMLEKLTEVDDLVSATSGQFFGLETRLLDNLATMRYDLEQQQATVEGKCKGGCKVKQLRQGVSRELAGVSSAVADVRRETAQVAERHGRLVRSSRRSTSPSSIGTGDV